MMPEIQMVHHIYFLKEKLGVEFKHRFSAGNNPLSYSNANDMHVNPKKI